MTNLKLKINTTVNKTRGMSLINVYERFKTIKNNKFIIVDENNLKYLHNIFDDYFKIILFDTTEKMITIDNKELKSSISSTYKNLIFDLVEGTGYYIKF